MSEKPGGEPTEEPTPRRLRQARERGQIAASGDFTSAAGFLAAVGAVVASAGALAAALTEVMHKGLARAADEAAHQASLGGALPDALSDVARLSLPLLGAAFIAAVVVGGLQSGGLFTFSPLKPKLDKLNPLEGLKKLVSAERLQELVKAVVKMAVVVVVAWVTLLPHTTEVVRLVGAPPIRTAAWTWALVGKLLFRVALAYGVIGAFDYLWQRYRWKKGLRMTREEVKREHKEDEGDPQHKAERRRLHQEILRHATVEAVRSASVIIVNPEHIAVALRWDEGELGAPEVVAKGEDLVAQQIREVAKQFGVPIYRDVALARALNELDLGDEIPEALYDAVAEVLRFVQGAGEPSAPGAGGGAG
jgi:flagellar biosynthesis protein FlhB